MDDRPRRNGLPLVSKKRWAAGHRGGLNPISDKRRKALRNKAMDVPRSQRTCELLPLLTGVSAWIKYRSCWLPGHPDWQKIDRHHVFRNRSSCDEPWNIVLACRPAHQFVGEAWQQAGQVVCMIALHRAGRLNPRAMSANIKPDPLWQVEHWLDNERLFDREPMLKLYSMELLNYYGRAA